MSDRRAVVAEALRVHGTLYADERETLIRRWSRLNQRLQAFHNVTIDLYIRDRDANEHKVTLEVRADGFNTFVAKTSGRDLTGSLNEVRDDMVRQLNQAKEKREPKNNRRRRTTD
ncbi:MAG: hypothetical protein CSA55_05315 [Ilumatobacter coccineus]|uniref:Ribosome-associated translation inhibitor RaiA n=1 Tax=Ilumatobacter coccineus TaxID=467094 RepID=A0A2G6K7H6_9ACTN|nr:MAG: hypothetical protein CSA55_05315 [Ilumatobacter coccineus]